MCRYVCFGVKCSFVGFEYGVHEYISCIETPTSRSHRRHVHIKRQSSKKQLFAKNSHGENIQIESIVSIPF